MPTLLAIDGRSGAGKSHLSRQVLEVVPRAVVACTDDLAWHHCFFDWADLLIDGVLGPAREGLAVEYVPPGWRPHGRDGAVRVPAGTELLMVEGVGSSRRELTPYRDGVIWVESDPAEARRRGIERDGGDDAAAVFWDEWSAEEEPFLAADRPWDRAHAVVLGTPRVAPSAHAVVFQMRSDGTPPVRG